MNQRQVIGATLIVSGFLLAGIQIVHAFQQTRVAVAIAVDAVPFAAMGLALSFTGYWLASDPEFDDTIARVTMWGAGGTVAFAAVAALLLFSQRVTTGTLVRANFLAVDLITVGALAGVLVGVYDARSRSHLRELERERDRVEMFARKAADVNNYGRAIGSAGSLDAIAAYVVEAVGTLTGIRETAVVRINGNRAELIANAIRTVDEATIGELAEEIRDQSQGTVVIYDESSPVELPENAPNVLASLVIEDGETATAIISVSTDEAAIREEDRKLLELIVSHAAAGIRDLGAQNPKLSGSET